MYATGLTRLLTRLHSSSINSILDCIFELNVFANPTNDRSVNYVSLKLIHELNYKNLQGAYLPQLDETLKLGDMEVTAERHYSLKNCQVIKYFISQVLIYFRVIK